MKNKRHKLHVKTGDTVLVISGDDKGKQGKVLAVSPSEGKIIVEGVNMIKKHMRPQRMGEAGGIIEAEAAMYASKVMLINPKDGKRTRVNYRYEGTGTERRKIRYANTDEEKTEI